MNFFGSEKEKLHVRFFYSLGSAPRSGEEKPFQKIPVQVIEPLIEKAFIVPMKNPFTEKNPAEFFEDFPHPPIYVNDLKSDS